MKAALSLATLLYLAPAALAANFTLVKQYAGQDFFNDWDFTDNFDNTTNGDINYVPQSTQPQLAYIDSNQRAIIKVDNTSVVAYPNKRNSIRINSKDFYEAGTVWVFDAVHLPYGCAVWPSFWTKGADWPRQGEIDIVEGINTQTSNQMALHTFNGCNAASGTNQKGKVGTTNCNDTTGAGCTVTETTDNSYGASFASAGGGVWAAQFDATGIYIWFWNRASVPTSITTATDSIDISQWGAPSAAYPSSSCDIGKFFGAQQMVIDITLCGDWAGVPSLYQPVCGGDGAADGCYRNSVINAGSPNFDNAYFEINYIKAFGVNSSVITNFAGAVGSSTSNSPSGGSSGSGGAQTTSAGGSTQTGSGDGSGAFKLNLSGGAIWGVLGAGVLALLSGLML
ncbi:unnamed protein product [Somion occarium]|uniref:GH16 domain-containing protein n=1 Tax=Somion occarium TaxID=3059160 RepID=A0ABP1CRL3_9APHY